MYWFSLACLFFQITQPSPKSPVRILNVSNEAHKLIWGKRTHLFLISRHLVGLSALLFCSLIKPGQRARSVNSAERGRGTTLGQAFPNFGLCKEAARNGGDHRGIPWENLSTRDIMGLGLCFEVFIPGQIYPKGKWAVFWHRSPLFAWRGVEELAGTGTACSTGDLPLEEGPLAAVECTGRWEGQIWVWVLAPVWPWAPHSLILIWNVDHDTHVTGCFFVLNEIMT